MKHYPASILMILLGLCMAPTNLRSQTVEQGNSIISIGYGFPNLGKGIFRSYASMPEYKVRGFGPAQLKYEYMYTDQIGLGLSVNFVQFTVSYTGQYIDHTDGNGNPVYMTRTYSIANTAYNALFRANYHLINDDKKDIYVGGGIGYRGGGFTATATPKDPNWAYGRLTPFPIGMELTVGARYFFTDNIGAYAEFGAAKSLFQVGLCLKM
jgi:hypothetical protein